MRLWRSESANGGVAALKARSLKSGAANAALVEGDLEAAVRWPKARLDGEIEAEAGPELKIAALERSMPKRGLCSRRPRHSLIGRLYKDAVDRFGLRLKLRGKLGELGLVDEYRLYLRPFVLGRGKPFFTGPRPPLRLAASDRLGADTIRLTYVPA